MQSDVNERTIVDKRKFLPTFVREKYRRKTKYTEKKPTVYE